MKHPLGRCANVPAEGHFDCQLSVVISDGVDEIGVVRPRIRKIVLGLVVGFLAISAGCSAVQGNEDSSTRLHIANQDDTNHAVLVEIIKNEDVVYSAGRTIEGESDAELEPFSKTGEYKVVLTVDGHSTVTTYRFMSDESATTIGVNNEGNVTIGT